MQVTAVGLFLRMAVVGVRRERELSGQSKLFVCLGRRGEVESFIGMQKSITKARGKNQSIFCCLFSFLAAVAFHLALEPVTSIVSDVIATKASRHPLTRRWDST